MAHLPQESILVPWAWKAHNALVENHDKSKISLIKPAVFFLLLMYVMSFPYCPYQEMLGIVESTCGSVRHGPMRGELSGFQKAPGDVNSHCSSRAFRGKYEGNVLVMCLLWPVNLLFFLIRRLDCSQTFTPTSDLRHNLEGRAFVWQLVLPRIANYYPSTSLAVPHSGFSFAWHLFRRLSMSPEALEGWWKAWGEKEKNFNPAAWAVLSLPIKENVARLLFQRGCGLCQAAAPRALASLRGKATTLASLTRQTGELMFAWQFTGLLNSGFRQGKLVSDTGWCACAYCS